MPMPLRQPETSRRQWLQQAAVACALVPPLAWAQGKDKHLPSTTSLPLSLQQALQTKQPLVVMVSLEGCAFCKVVRENYLLPLQREGLPMVQINMRDKSALVGFDGTPQTQDALIRQWGIKIAPTVLFFGERGQEVASRLNGAYLPDFYNAYLEEQLTIARRAVLR
jgi:thioredoxin-related protein